MGEAGQIIQWILALVPALKSILDSIIGAFKKTPPAPGAASALDAVVPSLSTATLIGYVLHLLPYLGTLSGDLKALVERDGLALPDEVKEKVGEAGKFFSDVAVALGSLPDDADTRLEAVKTVVQDVADVLNKLAA